MIELLSDLPDDTLGFKLTGNVTGNDYDDVLTPAIDKALEKQRRIKLLAQVGPDFDGYSLDAAWDDARLGLSHWKGFARVAVVTNVGWVRGVIRGMSFMMPCPVQVFALEEREAAERWLTEALGSIHLSRNGEVLTVRLLGKLEPSAYEGKEEEIDNMMSQSDHVRLLLDLREFEGWAGLSALGDHLSLIRDHRHVPERIAVVGDKAWQKMAEQIMSRFVNARTQFFAADDYNGAAAWIAA